PRSRAGSATPGWGGFCASTTCTARSLLQAHSCGANKPSLRVSAFHGSSRLRASAYRPTTERRGGPVASASASPPVRLRHRSARPALTGLERDRAAPVPDPAARKRRPPRAGRSLVGVSRLL